jgi:demethylmenaquinone methyltransferase/2-methoxy-6-polyprenyl-1,4-benzoquinol methylase
MRAGVWRSAFIQRILSKVLSRLGVVIWDLFLELVCRHYRVSGDVALRNLGLTGNETVLDLGGGTGGVAARLRPSARQVVVVEPDAGRARRGQGRFPQVGFVLGRGESVPFADDTFDVVLLVEVLHHVPDHRSLLIEAARVLRPGGRVLIEEFEFHGSVRAELHHLVERLISSGVWPRSKEGLCAVLAELGLSATRLEHEGFVILARSPAGLGAGHAS